MRGTKLRRYSGLAVRYLLLVLMGILFVLPFAWLVSSAFKPANQMYVLPPKWIPSPPILDNFTQGWDLLPFGRYLMNTVFVAVVGAAGTVISSAFVAYGFARFRSRACRTRCTRARSSTAPDPRSSSSRSRSR